MQYLILDFISIIAFAKVDASSVDDFRTLKVIRWAVFLPIPGKRENSSINFSIVSGIELNYIPGNFIPLNIPPVAEFILA